MPNIEISEKFILFLEFIPIFLISLAIHEFAHALSAYKMGDPTVKALGRMTLNPVKHLDLVGSIIMPFLSYFTGMMFIGWAKPVPVNRSNFGRPEKDDILVSLAGPFANLLLAFILTGVLAVFYKMMPDNQMLLKLIWLGVTFNVFLFLFNILPFPPLDGSHVILDLFPHSAYARFINMPWFGTLILFLFIFSPLWRYFIYAVEFILKILAGFVV